MQTTAEIVSSIPEALAPHPRIRALTARQSAFVLARNHVGRIAWVDGARPAILPVHYVFSGGRIVGRTSPGRRTAIWRDHPDVVFEVDESERLFLWRSVLVTGRITLLDRRGNPAQRREYLAAVDAFRGLHPDALTVRDPVPHRQVMFVVTPVGLTGREALGRH